MQRALFKDVTSGIKEADRVRSIGAWIELERLKREMRGIPPLAPHKLADMPLRRIRRALRPPSETPQPPQQQTTDIEATKESLEPPAP